MGKFSVQQIRRVFEDNLGIIMPPTSKKLWGHIGFGLCVRTSIRHFLMHAISYEPCMLGFSNFIYGFLMEK